MICKDTEEVKLVESQYDLFDSRHKFPLAACSLSIASNNALKFPLPKLFAPFRCMISKNKVGLSSTGFVNNCNK